MTNSCRAAAAIALFCVACTHPDRSSDPPQTHDADASQPAEMSLTPEQQADAGITLATVTTGSDSDVEQVSGRVVLPDTQVWRVGVRTDGLVETVAVSVGDFVRRGQLLARYHADELRDARAKYRAALADVERARAAEMLALRNATRADTLLELKAASVQQAEAARQDAVAAGAATRTAEIEVNRLRHVLEHDLQVPVDLDPDSELADQVPIYAPGSGYVLERNVSAGRAVHTTDDAFVIGDPSRVWVLASLREDEVTRIHVDSAASIALPGGTDTFAGRVSNIGQQADASTRTVPIRIVVDNRDGRLRPEMLANVAIGVGTPRQVLVVPSDAVQQIGDEDVVFVVSAPARFRVRPIRVGSTSGNTVDVLQGLKAGEQVVVSGAFILKSQLLRAAIDQ